ncbi:MAG: chemotaxis protein CheA [Candidatus Caenarcaniphilales bacterium]|nr:chemotaxis protein CheA [Candidatus Caenarcaniphilales bacterium]
MQSGEEYWDLFFDEVETHLESLNHQITNLESSPNDVDIVHEIFRIVHTIKGMAATIGFQSIAKLCHKMEELFDFYRKNPRSVENSTIEIEIKALDSLYKVVESISENGEELSSCNKISETLCNELIEELNKLQVSGVNLSVTEDKNLNSIIKQKPIPKANQFKVKVKFDEDCQMPSVRAFMATEVIEKNGNLISSVPDKDQFNDVEIISEGLTASILASQPIENIKENILKISDVIKVEIEAIAEEKDKQYTSNVTRSLEENNSLKKSSPLEGINPLSLDHKMIIERLNEKEQEELFNGTLKAYHIDLLLAEDINNPEEQLINLVNNFNDYIGHVIHSIPSLEDLEVLKLKRPPTQTISSIINSESELADHNEEKQRRKMQFILLINGTHKNVLDFLSDACEINKVEVKEIKVSSPDKKTVENNTENLQKHEVNEAVHIAQPKAKHSDIKTTFVRVNLGTLESLMNAVGELVINHNKIKLSMGDSPSSEILSTTQYLNQVTTKIQQLVMSIRMVPVNQVFSRFPRFIRDISRELKKDVHLVQEGENTEVDRIIVDELNEIFIHLVRNAIDHGIETADEREKYDKPKSGLIKMQAYSHGNNVFVTISDDGKGINPDELKRKAIQKKIITIEQAEALSKDEILNLIFATGLSTAEHVSDLSGRGVGMDIVKSKVSSLGGRISINSILGEGTSIRLSIPSTISIIQALLINNKSGLYAIPLSEIKEIVSINIRQDLHQIGSCSIIVLHDQVIPLVNLEKYLQASSPENFIEDLPPESLVVVVACEGNQYGLIVDSLVGQQEIVIKTISNRANPEGLINGATVFGDGRVAMILNVEKIIKLYLNDNPIEEIPEGFLLEDQGNDFDERIPLLGK